MADTKATLTPGVTAKCEHSQFHSHSALTMPQQLALLTIASLAITFVVTRSDITAALVFDKPQDSVPQCRAPLLPISVFNNPVTNHPAIRAATQQLDTGLDAFFRDADLESLAVAVVTGEGSVFESFRGVQRANETDPNLRGTVDRHSIYRLASISKLFTATKTLMLRDAGLLKLDDEIGTILEDFPKNSNDPITVRQLLAHMSGILRECPPGSSNGTWPESLNGTGPPGYSGVPFPDRRAFLDAISATNNVAAPYTFPSYSNAGFSVLGLANLEVTRRHEGLHAPSSHAALLERDIFTPLGLNGSSFGVSGTNKDRVVMSSTFTKEVDFDFGDVTNPAGGQMSSLSDLVKFLSTLLNPNHPDTLLRAYTLREWFRPLHVWWDDFSEVGAPWEIFRQRDSYDRNLRIYCKSGELIGFHNLICANPSTGFGIVILTTGSTMQTFPLKDLIMSHFQPAFDTITEGFTKDAFVGDWSTNDVRVNVSVSIISGSLFVTKYEVGQTNVLNTINGGGSAPIALWHTQDLEFRLARGAPGSGCLLEWVGLDDYAHDRGFATNLIKFTGKHGQERLLIPALGAELRRTT
ncbi:hypothetical protein ONZ45_g7630 [Pleurotus djamor]|nr:hypothetical protein ONZ45_g7630 [Pleurotus djamor]